MGTNREVVPFAVQLREAMDEQGWSVARLAHVLDVNADTVSHWRAGRRLPRLDMALRVAALFKLDLGKLPEAVEVAEVAS